MSTKRNVSKIIIALAVLVLGAAAPANAQQSAPRPVEAEPFRGQVYRSLDGDVILTLISRDELELRENGPTFLCKYTKQNDALRVIVTALGTTQVLYFRFVDEGLRANDGTVLYTPAKLDAAKQAILAEKKRKQEAELAVQRREEEERRRYAESTKAKLVERRKKWDNFFAPGSFFAFKVLKEDFRFQKYTNLLHEGTAIVLTSDHSDDSGSWAGRLTGRAEGKHFSGNYRVFLRNGSDGRRLINSRDLDSRKLVVSDEVRINIDSSRPRYYEEPINSPNFGDLDIELQVIRSLDPDTRERIILTKLTPEEKRLAEQRADEEKSARLAAMAEAPNTLVGTWRNNNGRVTYKPDGSWSGSSDKGNVTRGTWAIDGGILTITVVETNGKALANAQRIQRRILEIDTSKVVTQSIKDKTVSQLTRVK